MKLVPAIILFFVHFLLQSIPEANATTQKDSIVSKVDQYSQLYASNPQRTDYVDSIAELMNVGLAQGVSFTNQELLSVLASLRNTLNKENYIPGRFSYYALLANFAQAAGNDGEMLYYAEKIEKIEKQSKDDLSTATLTIISDYYNTKSSYQLTKDLYEKHKNQLDALISTLKVEQNSEREIIQLHKLLGKFATAFFFLNDTNSGNQVIGKMESIETMAIDKKISLPNLAHIQFLNILIRWNKAKLLHDTEMQWKYLSEFESLLFDPNTPDNLKGFISFTVDDYKAILFLGENKPDSALFYIDKLANTERAKNDLYTRYMVTKYKAQSLYQKGLYQQSVDTLVVALILLEEFKSQITQDISSMMYARAQTEEQQILLEEARLKNQRTYRILAILSISLILIILGSYLYLKRQRRKQRERFLNFKLNLARSIHDEANPALLYTKALLKSKFKSSNDDYQDLAKHINHTMQLIRSLSHDLKSENQYKLSDLLHEVKDLLDKLNVNQEFSCEYDIDIDKNRFLSHFQFTQIKAIINECVANTIKHADFDKIKILFLQVANTLQITYADNGNGWDPSVKSTGIGFENIEERTTHLNGSLKVQNDYPKGYQIQLSVLLK